jgi:hypothetical protein
MIRSIINDELFNVLSCHIDRTLNLPWVHVPYYGEIEGKKVVIVNVCLTNQLLAWVDLGHPPTSSPLYRLLKSLDSSTFVIFNTVYETTMLRVDPSIPINDNLCKGLEYMYEYHFRAIFEAAGFDTKRIIVLSPNKEAFLTYSPWKDMFSVVEFNAIYEQYYQTRDRLEEINTEPRSKRFVTLNATPRPHRTELYNWLRIEDLLDECHYTYSAVVYPQSWCFGLMTRDKRYYSLDFYKGFDPQEHHRGTVRIPATHFTRRTKNNNRLEDLFWNDAYIHLVTETSGIGGPPFDFYTEKTMKVFDNFQLPLIMASRGYVSYMRRKGYHMFDDFLDHSYDDKESYLEYFDLYVREVKRLSELDIRDIHDYYHKNRDALEYNREQLHRDYIRSYEVFNQEFREIIHGKN